MDIFISRGAWLHLADAGQSLLRNNGDGTFTDVTAGSRAARAGQFQLRRLGRLRQRRLARPVRLLRAADQPPLPQPGRRHLRGGRRQGRRAARPPSCSARAPPGSTTTTTATRTCSSTTSTGDAQLFHNNRDGTFTDVTRAMGIDGPARRLLVLGLGLRQRRLARHLRHLLRPHAGGRGQGPARPAARPSTRTGSSAT